MAGETGLDKVVSRDDATDATDATGQAEAGRDGAGVLSWKSRQAGCACGLLALLVVGRSQARGGGADPGSVVWGHRLGGSFELAVTEP